MLTFGLEVENSFSGFIFIILLSPTHSSGRMATNHMYEFLYRMSCLSSEILLKQCDNFAVYGMSFFSPFVQKSRGFFFISLLLCIFNENVTHFLDIPF